MKILVFELDHKLFGMDITYVLSIEKNAKIVPIPNAPQYIDGVSKLRNQIMPVYSLAKKFDYEISEQDQDYVIMELKERNVVYHVGKVQKMIEVDETQITSIEDSILKEQKNMYQVVTNDEELVVLLDAEQMITEQDRECFQAAQTSEDKLWEEE